MLYVSQPKGVGFSYCDAGSASCKNDDKTSAQDFYDFAVRTSA
jgi:carboxypeptidase C (cathepsin A)